MVMTKPLGVNAMWEGVETTENLGPWDGNEGIEEGTS